MRLLVPAVLTASLCTGCLKSDATAPTTRPAEQPTAVTTKATAPKAKSAAPAKPEPVIRLSDSTPWGEYHKNVAAADLKLKGKLVEFRVTAEVESMPSGKYVLSDWNRGGLQRHTDRIMHAIQLKSDQAERAAILKTGQVVTVRARVVGYTHSADAQEGKCVVLDDGEIVATMRWDAKARAYVPE